MPDDDKTKQQGRRGSSSGGDDAPESGRDGQSVATEAQNEGLEHTDGGVTTRDDAMDLGVPMLQGDPKERVGPEDALGVGPKRGNYEERQDGAPHFESVPNPKGGEPIKDKDGNVIDYEPAFIQQRQNERVQDVGEVAGKKGGVETADQAS